MKEDKFYCPTYDMSCPYLRRDGSCKMYPEFNPEEECDEAMCYADED